MTGKDRHSPAATDLQQIVDASQAQIKAQPDRSEHMATHTDNPPTQQVLRVQMTVNMPIPHSEDHKLITCSMNMMTPFPRVPSASTNKPTTPPTDTMRREHMCNQRAAQLQSAESTMNTPPHIRTQAQVATAAAQIAPLALSTRLCTRQSNLPPLSCRPGLAAAMMGQQ